MSALTSLLVRDDVVSVRQIEDALQRQVLEGGEFDTALLELTEIPENVLIAYRAASFRALPASRDDVMGASTATQSLLLSEVAEAFAVTPISHDTTTLTVAAVSPLSDSQVEELSAKIGMRVDWRISSELRVSVALARFYGVLVPPRMRELATRVDARGAGELPAVEPLQVTPTAALSADLLLSFDESEDFEAALEAAFDRVSAAPRSAPAAGQANTSRKPVLPLPAAVQMRALGAEAAPSSAGEPKRPAEPETDSRVVAAPARRGSATDTANVRTPAARKRQRPRPRRGQGIPAGPLTDAVAAQVLDQADDRDTVIEVFFRYARQYFDTTALFTVRDDRALGLEAYNLSDVPDIREVTLLMLRGSALEDLVRSLLPRVVDLMRKDEDCVFAQSIARTDSQPSALIPVCIKRRVVSFVYGDRNGEPFQLDDLSPLVGLLPHVSRAFERIIRTRKVLAVHTHRALRDFQQSELGRAQTQRQLGPSELARTSLDPAPGAPGGLLLAEARTKQALNSLGVPRTAPPPPAPRESLRGAARVSDLSATVGDVEGLPPTARISLDDALGTTRPSKPPTPYFSKPPPGTGSYSNPPDAVANARSSTKPEQEDNKPDAVPADDTKPMRRRTSAPPKQGRSSEPAADSGSAKSRVPARASKPPPGAGSYRSQVGTTERVSVPPRSIPPHASTNIAEAAAERARTSSPQPPRPRSPLPEAAQAVSAARAPSPAPRAPTIASATASHEPSIVIDERSQLEMLITELCRTPADQEGPLVQRLLQHGDEALELLVSLFPGPLWFDRRRSRSRTPLGRDIGPVPRALAAFGDKPFARFASLLRSQNVEIRYYSTLFVSDRVYPGLLEPLIERLFDEDPQIRLLVRDTLPHYRRVAGFSRVVERLRSQAGDGSAPLKARMAALDAISVLRDAMSVPILIELLTHDDKQISVPAHRAIVAITCQDFAKSTKKWRSWYQDNAGRHRVEWLIEALMHSDQGLRGAAGLELQKITQVYYGFAAAAPKREREQAQKRYWAWWNSEGRAKV